MKIQVAICPPETPGSKPPSEVDRRINALWSKNKEQEQEMIRTTEQDSRIFLEKKTIKISN